MHDAQHGNAAPIFREMTHRIFNEYGSAIAMLSRAAAKAANPEARIALQNAADRLNHYANAHQALQMPADNEPVDLTDHICKVCRAVYRSRLHDRGISLAVAGESVAVTAQQCWYVGLIVSELITNAARHAFTGRAGSIRVETRSMDDQVLCTVIDDGAAAVRPARGSGSEINDALAAQLGGTLSRTFSSSGTTATLTFPCRPICLDGSIGVEPIE